MKKILVTGASGQLGRSFQKYQKDFPQFDFTFVGSEDLDITLSGFLDIYFRKHNFDFCINCAAYTNVEKAESDREMAFLVNSEAVKSLAHICKENEVTLFHFSTDYVFDGKKETPYSEEDETNPLNTYGASKLSGEECIEDNMEKYFIFRTSWLYSEFGKNFLKTIIEKAERGEDLKITTAQKGTPTNAGDLALFVLSIIAAENREYGLYHYSNTGEATWFDFAAEILQVSGKGTKINLEKNNDFTTVATRPEYSILSKEKVINTFNREILPWQESLRNLIESSF